MASVLIVKGGKNGGAKIRPCKAHNYYNRTGLVACSVSSLLF
jgi:hypothetical protein